MSEGKVGGKDEEVEGEETKEEEEQEEGKEEEEEEGGEEEEEVDSEGLDVLKDESKRGRDGDGGRAADEAGNEIDAGAATGGGTALEKGQEEEDRLHTLLLCCPASPSLALLCGVCASLRISTGLGRERGGGSGARVITCLR